MGRHVESHKPCRNNTKWLGPSVLIIFVCSFLLLEPWSSQRPYYGYSFLLYALTILLLFIVVYSSIEIICILDINTRDMYPIILV